MKKNIGLLYCILGSVILSTTSLNYGVIRQIRWIGLELAQLTYYISAIGVLLTIIFSIMLILQNLNLKGGK